MLSTNPSDAEEFLKAMVKEVDDHVRREHWRIVSIGDMLASGYKEKPIMGVWSMKRKHNPIGMIDQINRKCRLTAMILALHFGRQ